MTERRSKARAPELTGRDFMMTREDYEAMRFVVEHSNCRSDCEQVQAILRASHDWEVANLARGN